MKRRYSTTCSRPTLSLLHFSLLAAPAEQALKLLWSKLRVEQALKLLWSKLRLLLWSKLRLLWGSSERRVVSLRLFRRPPQKILYLGASPRDSRHWAIATSCLKCSNTNVYAYAASFDPRACSFCDWSGEVERLAITRARLKSQTNTFASAAAPPIQHRS